MERMLTVEDVADLLQVEVPAVRRLIEAGQLASVTIGTAVRVRPSDVEACVASLARDQALDALGNTLSDPRAWARNMDPDLKAQILAADHAPGTMGAFLKEAVEASEAKAAAGNIVDLPSGPKRSS